MGVYLAKPRTQKNSDDGGDGKTGCRFGLTAMQGWRQFMEDAHLADPSFTYDKLPTCGVFGVFDGHGGPAVSAWTAGAFDGVLREELEGAIQELQRGDFTPRAKGLDPSVAVVCEALQRTFMKLDERLHNQENRDLLKELHDEAEAEKKKFTEGTDPQQPESLLDAVLSGVAGVKPTIRVIEQDGQRFYQLLARQADDEDLNEPTELRVHEMEEEDEEIAGRDHGDEPEVTTEVSSEANRRRPEVGKALETLRKDVLEGEEEPEEASPEAPLGKMLNDQGPMLPFQPEYCGTTAIVAVLIESNPPVLVTANAGDSRAVLCRGGVAVPLSVDHKPGLQTETDRIVKAGGNILNGRVDGNLNLSRSIGDLMYKNDINIPPELQKITAFPDVRLTVLSPDDEFVVIACDGIWDCMTNQQAVTTIFNRLKDWEGGTSEGQLLSKVCEEICDMCISDNPLESEGGIGCDNMTIMILLISQGLRERATAAVKASGEVVLYGEVATDDTQKPSAVE